MVESRTPVEDAAMDEEHHQRGKLSASLSRRRSSSFSLRSPSLNSLRLRRVFDLFDKNGDGVITLGEISQALFLLGLEAEQSELNSIVTSFIRPGFDGLAYSDFEALHKSLNHTFFDCIDEHPGDDHNGEELVDAANLEEKEVIESDLTEAFKVFDQDGDGFISAMELQTVLSKLGLPEANQELGQIQLMISSFDLNHDGHVDFIEFKDMMLRSVLATASS
uniref:EF-hand domain-containing protein n=2 Tax=Opuntia streptacantha TaxID=393608 RepID=A0A7C8ZHY8_OPUST